MRNQISDFKLDGKVAIIFGGGRGIGRAISLVLADAGANISVVGRTAKYIGETADLVRQCGSEALAISADVTHEEQVQEAAEETISHFGKIDILCSSAGIQIENPVVVIPGVKMPGWDGGEKNWDNYNH